MPHQGSDISRQIKQFGKGLSSFSRRLEDDIAELKKAVSSKPHTGRELLAGWAPLSSGQALPWVEHQALKLCRRMQMHKCSIVCMIWLIGPPPVTKRSVL